MEQKKIILPSSYFPSIEYFYLMIKYKQVLIETSDFYIKQSIRNHSIILGPNGDQKITVPINRKNKTKTIFKDLKIAMNPWRKNHIKSIKTAYANSPFYLYYHEEIFKIISKDFKFLLELNKEILFFFIKELNINVNITYTDKYIKDYGEEALDFRTELKNSKNDYYIKYQQTFLNSTKRLNKYSIIDLLFNLGNESKEKILSEISKTNNYI